MSRDNPTQVLTTYELSTFRSLQSVTPSNGPSSAPAAAVTIAPTAIDNQQYNNYKSNQCNISNNNNSCSNSNSNTSHKHTQRGGMVLSTTRPLEGYALLLQQAQIIPTTATIAGHHHQQHQHNQNYHQSLQSHHQQQQHHRLTTSTTNGVLRSSATVTGPSAAATAAKTTTTTTTTAAAAAAITSTPKSHHQLSHSVAAVATPKTSIVVTNSVKSIVSSGGGGGAGSNGGGNNMPTTSNYVFLQQHSNGQFTTYEGTAAGAVVSSTSSSNGGNGSHNNSNSVGNIVLLATEPLDIEQQHQQKHLIATNGTGDNDEELRSLAWLSDRNLLNGIVTGGSATATAAAMANAKRGNICILNASSSSNVSDLIEELPTHVASEEHVATTTTIGDLDQNELGETQITPLSANNFQQQFIASSKRFGGNIVVNGSSSSQQQQQQQQQQLSQKLASYALAQQPSMTIRDHHHQQHHQQQQQHVYNIAPIGATTTVHVGPSGTTTVVEYKSTSPFMAAQRQLLSGGNGSASGSNIATITATNLGNNNSNNNNNNNYVPSSPSSSQHCAAATESVVSSASATATTPPRIASCTSVAAGNGTSSVVVVSSSTNSLYQGQRQQQQQLGNSNATISIASTTHHPHKKYLREKMNVLVADAGSNTNTKSNNNYNTCAAPSTSASSILSPSSSMNGGGGSGHNNSTITVVSSPASSNNSLSSVSGASTVSSTAAVNGGNSPVSKSYYAAALNYSTNNAASSTATAVVASSYAAITATTSVTPQTTSTIVPAYTIVGQTQNLQTVSPVAKSSPESPNCKDYYTLSAAPHQHQNSHQPQHQQHQHQRSSLRSPISYSSYDNDSLKDFDLSNTTNASASAVDRQSSATGSQYSHHGQHVQNGQQPSQTLTTKSSSPTSISASASNSGHVNASGTPQKQKHPNNVPYDPLVHTHNKPPYSFSSLIFMAIEGSEEKALPVKEIYAWIVQHFPYFKTAPTGWKNSVRHNLSLNKSFVKVEKAPNMGKGSLWRVEQQQRQNLIQALTRSPFFPNSGVDKLALKTPSSGGGTGGSGCNTNANGHGTGLNYDAVDGGAGGSGSGKSLSGSHLTPRFDSRLYPNLAKAFNEHHVLGDVPDDEVPSDYSTTSHNNNYSNIKSISKYGYSTSLPNGSSAGGDGVIGAGATSAGFITGAFSNYESIECLARDCGADSIDDVNAATAMLALKHGPKVFAETFQNGAPVITSSPSEDHTYSAGGSSSAGSGASTPLTNGSSIVTPALTKASSNGTGNGQQNGCDNQSNCASSDAAYESSEENHNITPEELEDQQRHRDGVDALLSLSLSSVIESSASTSSCSPVKRSSSTSVEQDHISDYMEVNNNTYSNSNISPPAVQQPHARRLGKMALLSSVAAENAGAGTPYHAILDEGYSTQTYYGSIAGSHHHQHQHQHQHYHHELLHLASQSPSPPKKPKPLRNLRTKIKRKAPWLR